MNKGQINRLNYKGGYVSVKGQNVLKLNTGLALGAGAIAGYGFFQIGQEVYNGNKSFGRGIIDAGVVGYSWKGEVYGAAVGIGYGVLDPMVVNSNGYQNWKQKTWLPFRQAAFGY